VHILSVSEKRDGGWTYQIKRFAASKYEINTAFNVAVLKEMVALVVTDGVLKSFDFTIVQGSLVAGYPQCERLTSLLSRIRPW
jgi:hypothetical protein